MKNKLQTKLLLRKIATSRGRFIAIILIILLGVLLFVGIKSVGPDLYKNAQTFMDEQHASDVQITATSGLTKDDIALAKKVPGAIVESEKVVTAVDTKENKLLQFYSLRDQQKLNRPRLKRGRMPKLDNEIVVDSLADDENNYTIGDIITVKTDLLKKKKYKIVGFVTSPQFVNKHSRPATSQGTVKYLAYVNYANFLDDEPSLINLRYNKLAGLNSFKLAYKNEIKTRIKQIKLIYKGRAKARQTSIMAKFNQQITSLEDAKKQISAAKQQVAAASNGQVTTTTELTTQEQEINDGLKQLNSTKKTLQEHPVEYLYNDRDDLPGYAAYGELSEQISVIANVFPLFFFLIAILITFTTMTRMVEEERTQIGTMKALGYHRREIERNYVWYALFAALIGIIFGSLIGINTLPRIVTGMMTNTFVFDETSVTFEWTTIFIAAMLALLATLGAVLLVTTRELREKPANLMLAKTPKAGKRILLERIKPLWSRLSFNRKVSYRNLFRFKSRMWMGIIGIAGGAGLILTGFGIRDSIAETSVRQYRDVTSYQAVAALTSSTNQTKMAQILNQQTNNSQHIAIHTESVTAEKSTKELEAVNLMVTDSAKKFGSFQKTSQPLNNAGILLSQKAASFLKVKAGGTISVKTTDGESVQLQVAGITENYVGHFIYLTNNYYAKTFGTKPKINAWLLKYDKVSVNAEESLSNKLLKQAKVVNVSFISTQQKVLNDQIANLGPIVAVFIVLSGLLTFVVLYNLTNINISERIRELSTIKVLGFFDREVTMYIVRENIVLTGCGIILGTVFGNTLLWFILQQAMTDQVVFPLTISWVGYVTSILLTVAFTVIVMLVTHRKLQNINMIDALKSNE